MAKSQKRLNEKKAAIKSNQESEDLGQVINPKLYIAPTPKKDASNSKDLEPNAIETLIKEENSSSMESELTTANTETTENAKEDVKRLAITETINLEEEEGTARKSARVSKKPDRWGHNVMVTKIEEASNDEEESVPSVLEIIRK